MQRLFSGLALSFILLNGLTALAGGGGNIIAYVNLPRVESSLNRRNIRVFSIDEKYSGTIRDLQKQSAQLEETLVKSNDDKTFEEVKRKLDFIAMKMDYLENYASRRSQYRGDNIEIKNFIVKNFGDKYLRITSSKSFNDEFFLVNNIEIVDITNDVIQMLNKELK